MRPVKLFALLLVALVLAACQTATPQADDELTALGRSGGYDSDDHRVRFLPPIAKKHPRGEFERGLAIEVRFFNLDVHQREAYGSALGPDLATDGGGISEHGDRYQFNWHAYPTYRQAHGEYVRLEIRLAGTPGGPACNSDSANCLGYLDVRLVPNMGRGAKGTPHGIMNVVKHSTLPVKFVVLALETVAPPETLGELDSLGGGSFDEELGNCVASELARPGQGLQAVGAGLQAVGAGLQAVGAVGGLFSGPTISFASDLSRRTTSPDAVAARLGGEVARGKDKRGVVLLVVDDFGGVYEVPHSLLAGDGDLLDLADSGALSHGAAVLHHLRQMAKEAFGGFSHSGVNAVTGQPYYKYRDGHGPYLAIQVVDVAGLNTDDVPNAIHEAMRFMGGQGPVGYQRVVVNMSFTVVPCTVLEDFGTAGLENFEAYLEAIRLANNIGNEYLAELDELVSTPVALAQEALFAYLDCPFPVPGSGRCDGRPEGKYAKAIASSIVHVGAAGNYGNDYALYPAAWPNVVSVGSLDVDGRRFSATRSSYSNAGGVLAPGGLFLLSDAQGQTTVYAGTSFAAPVVSLFLALDQMKETPRCAASQLGGSSATTPALALDDAAQLPLIAAFANSGSDAVGANCSARR